MARGEGRGARVRSERRGARGEGRGDAYRLSTHHSPLITGASRMEIVGIGTDIVECLRIGRMVQQHGELFLTRVYTPREIRYCQRRKHATEHFAGRWAAKEAVFKCLGTGWRRGLCWTDLEVRNDPDGKPGIYLRGAAR